MPASSCSSTSSDVAGGSASAVLVGSGPVRTADVGPAGHGPASSVIGRFRLLKSRSELDGVALEPSPANRHPAKFELAETHRAAYFVPSMFALFVTVKTNRPRRRRAG